MTHSFILASLDLIHAQRDDQPPDHAGDGHGDLVYDQTCRYCRAETAQQAPGTIGPLPAWLERDLDRVADAKEETP